MENTNQQELERRKKEIQELEKRKDKCYVYRKHRAMYFALCVLISVPIVLHLLNMSQNGECGTAAFLEIVVLSAITMVGGANFIFFFGTFLEISQINDDIRAVRQGKKKKHLFIGGLGGPSRPYYYE